MEEQIWAIIERWRIRSHPAYQLGWGLTSCLTSFFGDDTQRASVNRLAPERFRRIAQHERDIGITIRKGRCVEEMARRGQEFVSDKPEELRRLALSPGAFTVEMFILPAGDIWKAPAGAYKRCGRPS